MMICPPRGGVPSSTSQLTASDRTRHFCLASSNHHVQGVSLHHRFRLHFKSTVKSLSKLKWALSQARYNLSNRSHALITTGVASSTDIFSIHVPESHTAKTSCWHVNFVFVWLIDTLVQSQGVDLTCFKSWLPYEKFSAAILPVLTSQSLSWKFLFVLLFPQRQSLIVAQNTFCGTKVFGVVLMGIVVTCGNEDNGGYIYPQVLVDSNQSWEELAREEVCAWELSALPAGNCWNEGLSHATLGPGCKNQRFLINRKRDNDCQHVSTSSIWAR